MEEHADDDRASRRREAGARTAEAVGSSALVGLLVGVAGVVTAVADVGQNAAKWEIAVAIGAAVLLVGATASIASSVVIRKRRDRIGITRSTRASPELHVMRAALVEEERTLRELAEPSETVG